MIPRFGSRASLAALAFGWAVPLLAQDPAGVTDAGPAVRIAGAVVDAGTRDPVPSVQITLHRIGATGEPAWSGFSGRDGRFTTSSIPVEIGRAHV